jgi:predicted Zn finger-like uncharacterized protein
MMITRCPACGTMFRIVSDQLKVSQGWVRCGNCSDVFDASLHLQDEANFGAPATPLGDPVTPDAGEMIESAQTARAPSVPAFNDDFAQSLQKAIDAAASAREINGEPVASETVAQPEPIVQKPASETARLSLNEEIEAEESAEAADSVSFVKDARRQAFWKKKWVRIWLAIAALGLLLALLLQVIIQQRNQIAVLLPQLKPLIQAICEPLACQLAPLRKIDSVVIDSSTFTKLGNDNYKLDFSLKNLATVPLAMPSLEVTLTDTQDQPLLRRVLLPAQFGAAAGLLSPGVDFAGAITLDVSAITAIRAGSPAGLRVAGYRLLAFYP